MGSTGPAKDLIVEITGAWGRYQLYLTALLLLSKIPVAYHQIAIVFLAPKIKYICPSTNATTCPCPNPVYDTSIFTNTIVMKWNLICERRYLVSFAQTVFQAGTLVGSIAFGVASDRFGRAMPLNIAALMQGLAGIATALMDNYYLFCFMRFITGVATGGTMVTSFVIVMEFTGIKYRELMSAVYQIPFNLGHLLLPLNAYFFRDYKTLQLALSIPNLLLISYFFLVPDTPRWLIAVKKTEKAIVILEKVAKCNNRPTANIREAVEEFEKSLAQNQLKKGTFKDLFRTPNIRKNILVMSFDWLACSYCFYGVSQFVGQLSGNVFINVAASAFVTMLGTVSSIPLMHFLGRKTIVVSFNLICAVCLILLALVTGGTAKVVLASSGVVCAFIVFVLVYLYCSDLFPTVVRNAAIGYSSMNARIGSMIAPFVIDLKSFGAWVPPLVFATPPLIAGVLTFLFLPETKGHNLMTTIEEGENFGKKIKSTKHATFPNTPAIKSNTNLGSNTK